MFATKNAKINVFKKNKKNLSLHYFFTFLDHSGVAMWHNLLPEWFWPSILAKCHSRNFQKGGERYNKFSKEEAKGSKHYYTISDKKHSHKIEFPLTNSEKNNTAILCSTICMFFFSILYFHHDLFLTCPTFCFKDKLENVYTKNILFLPF